MMLNHLRHIINANWEDAINNEDINLASHLWEKEFLAILDKHDQTTT